MCPSKAKSGLQGGSDKWPFAQCPSVSFSSVRLNISAKNSGGGQQLLTLWRLVDRRPAGSGSW
jgi:hypothetical protein